MKSVFQHFRPVVLLVIEVGAGVYVHRLSEFSGSQDGFTTSILANNLIAYAAAWLLILSLMQWTIFAYARRSFSQRSRKFLFSGCAILTWILANFSFWIEYFFYPVPNIAWILNGGSDEWDIRSSEAMSQTIFLVNFIFVVGLIILGCICIRFWVKNEGPRLDS